MPDREARVQVAASEVEPESRPQGAVFNVWYRQWSGGRRGEHGTQVAAAHRCHPAVDLGTTQASLAAGHRDICFFFAKGACHLGAQCQYLHRVPGPQDLFPPTMDCFGRDKLAEYKKDMSGVGLLRLHNKTLYVLGLARHKDMEQVLQALFGEWGEVVRVRHVGGKHIAFVTYAHEASAQFAKEAMDGQQLVERDVAEDEVREVLTVRWAREDPSKEAQQRQKRELDEEAMETVKRLVGGTALRTVEKEKQETGRREAAPVLVTPEALRQIKRVRRAPAAPAAPTAPAATTAPPTTSLALLNYSDSD